MKGKIIFFIISFLLVGTIWYLLWYQSGLLDKGNYSDIAVEFHGMIFDVILFGIILTVYEYIVDNRDKIERYKNEIDDFRHWRSEEAMFRIVGNVKRLNKLKISKIDLRNVHLQRADLIDTNLKNADLSGADLRKAMLLRANLQGARLENTNLRKALLSDTNLEGANLNMAQLHDATAFSKQKESFSKVMTEYQLNSMKWIG